MATLSLSDLTPDVLLECPSCPEPLALREIQESARVLFRRAGVWRVDLDPITTVKNIPEYELSFPDDSEISNILDARHNDVEIFMKTVLWLNKNKPRWRTETGSQIKYFSPASKKIIRVSPIPTETKAISLDLRLSLTTTKGATTLDEDMFEDWHEVISHGAKARIMRIKNKPWSNPEGSAMYGRLYAKGITAAKIRANKDNTTQSLTVKHRYFA